ncbi:endonuclease/exonuclease/phosphatase family protein [Hephaestia sp. GCM10023244]|uniref:endonuclease/exonuclease/phosphatase family protein n=1 Tax=unclassified Hephaestia TaxID=2631281 RepID=UPI0020770D4C|nr:endonuclease/exonuclease/phosphatase family protein [Hephaestia sp. MAHUQ-44]MCM8730513.1 endonuclease/exonuclease/phosphatase family protein [Hephaestia sp. MAHUQ-44]
MRRLRFAAGIALLALAWPAYAADDAAPLKVMSFNVRWPSPDDGANLWVKRRDLFVDTIRTANPDVIGTQELYKSQADYVLTKLPDYNWFGIDRRGGHADEHMGIFYRRDRLTLVDLGNFWLSDTPDIVGSNTWGHPFPRMVTWGLFERKADGKRFYMYDTHLPYRDEDEDARTKGATLILSRIKALPPGVPFVMTGDFNTGPESAAHTLLTTELKDARETVANPQGPAETFHNFTGTPDHRIDWILYRGFTALGQQTITTHRGKVYPSDHFPLTAELAFPEGS